MRNTRQHETSESTARSRELIISAVLRTGVVLSLAIILGGLAFDLFGHPAQRSSSTLARHLLSAGAHYPHTFGAVLTGVVHGSAVSIMTLGLVVLVATPIARVAVSVLTFLHERDARFVAATTFVLVVLVGSFALGKVGG